MAAEWIERIVGSLDDKKRWRSYQTRKKQLPISYRTAIDGIERYLMNVGAIANGEVFMQMLEDLADLIERAAVDGTPIRDIVGEDPVDFADAFIENYAHGQWANKERKRLTDAIDQSCQAEHNNVRGGDTYDQ